MANKPVDPKSYELAEYFSADEPGMQSTDIQQLAEVVQEAVEGFFEWRRMDGKS